MWVFVHKNLQLLNSSFVSVEKSSVSVNIVNFKTFNISVMICMIIRITYLKSSGNMIWVNWNCCVPVVVCFRRSGSRTGRSCWGPVSQLQLRSPSCSRRRSTMTRSKATASCASPAPSRLTQVLQSRTRRPLTVWRAWRTSGSSWADTPRNWTSSSRALVRLSRNRRGRDSDTT